MLGTVAFGGLDVGGFGVVVVFWVFRCSLLGCVFRVFAMWVPDLCLLGSGLGLRVVLSCLSAVSGCFVAVARWLWVGVGLVDSYVWLVVGLRFWLRRVFDCLFGVTYLGFAVFWVLVL